MPTTEIFFLDRDYQPTTDRVAGRPSVNATVVIDGEKVMSAQPAVIDTGADFCVINENELSVFREIITPTDKSKIEYPDLRDADGDVYKGTITIHGLDEPVQTYFVPGNRRRFKILIGRHVLKHYTMTYDPLGRVFSLARP